MAQTVWDKLGVKPGFSLLLVEPPEDLERTTGGLPGSTTRIGAPPGLGDGLADPLGFDAAGRPDVILAFVADLDIAGRMLPALAPLEGEGHRLWVAYPKGRPREEINRDSLRERAVSSGLQAVSQVSVDDTWSALRFRSER